MRELLLSIDGKKIRKLLRDRDFVFCIISYPLLLVLYIVLKVYIGNTEFETDTRTYYRIVSFVVLGFISILSIFERIEKKAMHKVQGDKLKIKQKERNWKN